MVRNREKSIHIRSRSSDYSDSRSSDYSDSRSSDYSEESESNSKRGKKKSKITTEEQIFLEYIAKKSQKKAMKIAKKLKAQTVSGYSNDSNPFGDSNLDENFVWRKKIARDVAQGQSLEISVKAEKKRQKERMAEIEKGKKRREERAIEKARHEEEMAWLARKRARAENQDWEKREEEFHFDQSKVRSKIRLLEGRMKPIDILLKNLNGSDDFGIELNEQDMVFKAMMAVCNWELVEAWKRDAIDKTRAVAAGAVEAGAVAAGAVAVDLVSWGVKGNRSRRRYKVGSLRRSSRLKRRCL